MAGAKHNVRVDALIESLQKDRWDPGTHHIRGYLNYRSVRAQALANIGPKALPALRKSLTHKNGMVRIGCLYAIGKIL